MVQSGVKTFLPGFGSAIVQFWGGQRNILSDSQNLRRNVFIQLCRVEYAIGFAPECGRKMKSNHFVLSPFYSRK